jgi:hypothetical protein
MVTQSEPVRKDSQLGRLRLYNLIMGCFHLIQAAFIFALSNNYSLPVTSAFPTFDSATKTLKPVMQTLFNLPIGPLAAVFLLISAIAHLSLSTICYNWYVRNLKKGINPARWYEYAFSSSLMIVLIAMLSGMYDIAALILIFLLNAMMNLFGLMMELHNQTTQKTNWTSYIYGCVAGIVPWIAIAIYFFGSTSSSNGSVPTFVYFILPTLFVFFFTFALNMVLQYKKVGPWKDYLYGERVYVLLSLIAKSALAWQVFGGALAR